jgi:hypothetical protein
MEKQVCESGFGFSNRSYATGKEYFGGASSMTLETKEAIKDAGRRGELWVVRSTTSGRHSADYTRVIASAAEEAVEIMRGAKDALNCPVGEIHEVLGVIRIVPDPEWWTAWWSPVVGGALRGIEILDARIGHALSSLGTTAEQAWLGRALRSMGAEGIALYQSAAAITNPHEQNEAWEREMADRVGPFCELASEALTVRTSEADAVALGHCSAPLAGIAELVAREQVRTGKCDPFPAFCPGGWRVVWELPHGGHVATTYEGQLAPVPIGARTDDEYGMAKIAQDVLERGLTWCKKYRSDYFVN